MQSQNDNLLVKIRLKSPFDNAFDLMQCEIYWIIIGEKPQYMLLLIEFN